MCTSQARSSPTCSVCQRCRRISRRLRAWPGCSARNVSRRISDAVSDATRPSIETCVVHKVDVHVADAQVRAPRSRRRAGDGARANARQTAGGGRARARRGRRGRSRTCARPRRRGGLAAARTTIRPSRADDLLDRQHRKRPDATRCTVAAEQLIDLREQARLIAGRRGQPIVTVARNAGDVDAAEVPAVVDVHRERDDLGVEKIHRGLARRRPRCASAAAATRAGRRASVATRAGRWTPSRRAQAL